MLSFPFLSQEGKQLIVSPQCDIETFGGYSTSVRVARTACIWGHLDQFACILRPIQDTFPRFPCFMLMVSWKRSGNVPVRHDIPAVSGVRC